MENRFSRFNDDELKLLLEAIQDCADSYEYRTKQLRFLYDEEYEKAETSLSRLQAMCNEAYCEWRDRGGA